MTEPISRAAPAKINLYLHVTGRRDDGYHLLDSLIAFAAIGDTVTVISDDGLSLAIDGPFAPDLAPDLATDLAPETDNLVIRAANLLARDAGIDADASITLTKRLPIASGIGGGSADAAATLKALSDLWKLNIGEDDMCTLALTLGADVPVCVAGRASFIGGIGDEITPAPKLPDAGLLLVNPGIGVSTADIFKARSGDFSEPARFSEAPADAAALALLLKDRQNDLGPAAAGLAPAIGQVLAALAPMAGLRLARMSGSGATCFALFDDLAEAEAAKTGLSANRPEWWIAAAPLLNESIAPPLL